ncbi:MAG TPA: SDR family oxidoreductase [Candidatus Agrococcus pullicola]|uniref:SDR family oxidoreductase n=1 Tax=Candidatus Agrococcus pullicola TaxID=2838429 RepID=A0A9D2C7C5_9MICO|nr:SDR family oxidoreductase [Candidatus Agrococcus pullicola]
MTHIALFGGHGKIALLATEQLTQAGYAVRSVIRNPEQADAIRARGAEPFVADIEQPETDFAAILDGIDLVIWSAGAGGGNPARTKAVDLEAAKRAIDAAVKHGVRDFLNVSYKGARPDHGVEQDNPFWHYAEAKAKSDAALRASELDWVILAPTSLTLETGAGEVDAEITVQDSSGFDAALRIDSGGTPIAREDVATLIAQLVPAMVEGRVHHVTVTATGGTTPIPDVVAATVEAVREA